MLISLFWAVGSGSVFRPHTLFLLAEWIWAQLNRIPFAPVNLHKTHVAAYKVHMEVPDCHHSDDNQLYALPWSDLQDLPDV